MRWIGRQLGRLLAFLIIAGIALWMFGPYEPAPLSSRFDDGEMDTGLDAYFAAAEARFSDITEGVEKRVIWAGEAETQTPVAILYVHGFSATSQEIRPVPDRVADALGANLIYTRLTGHGRGGAAMAEASVAAWMADMAEALAAARIAGEQVVIISTSTGGTLAAAAAMDSGLSRDLAGVVFVSPNFGINNALAPLLTWPAARWWLPLIAGADRSFEPQNEDHGRYWTTAYPSAAVFPMAALVQAVAALDYSAARVPALFWYAPGDQVVRADVTADIAAAWGGDATVHQVTLGAGDDPYAHVVAGDILSPGQTDAAVQGMTDWIRSVTE